ncbi:hypothetical protein L3X38_024351 [Prunus dulcis]|uniref:DUF4216 domain-containing protein n=1 Tax=Prunus dulcis TaxID=3755 RepID=A0AAD4VZR7_PRUDU|nr:hypothetical protein L3X38_024351 [Prunus dulcis]
MHVEKNVFETLMGTILDIEGKTKNTIKARLDLERMGIRRGLWMNRDSDKARRDLAFFSMKPNDKKDFLKFVSSGKLRNDFYGKLTTVVQLLYKDQYQVIMFKYRWFDTNSNRQGNVKIDHGLLSVNINITWYDDDPYILANMTKQIMYLDDPKAESGWKVVQQMDQRNVYAIPELDPTENDFDNVADQRLESSMENDAETLRDTNVIQEPF